MSRRSAGLFWEASWSGVSLARVGGSLGPKHGWQVNKVLLAQGQPACWRPCTDNQHNSGLASKTRCSDSNTVLYPFAQRHKAKLPTGKPRFFCDKQTRDISTETTEQQRPDPSTVSSY